MNAFTTTAATFLSRYADNLLKEQCEEALSGVVKGDDSSTVTLVNSAIILMDSFKDEDFLTCGLHRINGSMVQQQKVVKLLESTDFVNLKSLSLSELSAEDRCGCLRLLLRKLPEPLFPHCQRAALIDLAESVRDKRLCEENALKALQILIYFIPEYARLCLKKLVAHLNNVVAQCATNRMGVENIALIFASAIFPIVQDSNSIEMIKNDVEAICQLVSILLNNSSQLFCLPDELIDTLESSVQKHVDENRMWECSSPVLKEDPELVMTETFSQRSTPTRSTTDMELARLMAEISRMPESAAKTQLMRRRKHYQRQQLGIQKRQSVLTKLIRIAKK